MAYLQYYHLLTGCNNTLDKKPVVQLALLKRGCELYLISIRDELIGNALDPDFSELKRALNILVAGMSVFIPRINFSTQVFRQLVVFRISLHRVYVLFKYPFGAYQHLDCGF